MYLHSLFIIAQQAPDRNNFFDDKRETPCNFVLALYGTDGIITLFENLPPGQEEAGQEKHAEGGFRQAVMAVRIRDLPAQRIREDEIGLFRRSGDIYPGPGGYGTDAGNVMTGSNSFVCEKFAGIVLAFNDTAAADGDIADAYKLFGIGKVQPQAGNVTVQGGIQIEFHHFSVVIDFGSLMLPQAEYIHSVGRIV